MVGPIVLKMKSVNVDSKRHEHASTVQRRKVNWIAKQTTLIQSNTTQVHFNAIGYLYMYPYM